MSGDEMRKVRSIALAAGGTGGHVYPAEALASELRQRGYRVFLITDHRGEPLTTNFPCDDKLVLKAASPSRNNPLKLLKTLWMLLASSFRAGSFLRTQSCTALVGFGGYPSVPSLMAAVRRKLPIVLHEQNAVLGRSNRMFAKKANWIASGFDQLQLLPEAAAARHVVVGNPLRPMIMEHLADPYPLTSGDLHLVLLGGSLGARILSECLPAAIGLLPQALRDRLHITAQITRDQVETARQSFARAGVSADIAPFFEDVAGIITKAHLVVARAGASSVSELAALGRPCILVPLKIAMDDHQTGNAKALKNTGAADIILEDALTPEKLAALLQARLSDADDLRHRSAQARLAAKTDATRLLADLVEQVTG